MLASASESEDKPYRLGTRPTRREYQARCIAPNIYDWRSLTKPDQADKALLRTLETELRSLDVVRGYVLKRGTGANRAVDTRFFAKTVSLPGKLPLLLNPAEPADAVWLSRKEAFVDIINGDLLFVARARGFCLAGRATRTTAELIVSAFATRMIEAPEIEVVTFFGSPPGGRRDQFREFAERADAAKIKATEHRFPLPSDGPYAYGGHPDTQCACMRNLGILARP